MRSPPADGGRSARAPQAWHPSGRAAVRRGVALRPRRGAGAREFTEYEETWARTSTDGRTDIERISESENAPSTASILERWRAIERQLDHLEPGSPESIRLFAEFERLRDEYMAAFQEHQEGDPE